MRIGVCMPYMVPDYDRDRILSWARRIERGPFSSLSCGERIIGNTFEMHTILTAAAAVTERVRIMPSLYVLPMRSAVLTAKEIATLDVISGGRVSATVGVGGRERDYDAVGASFAERHRRLDEQVPILRKVWRGEPVQPGGDPIGPVPPQGDRIPLYSGSMGPKSIARAARWADGIYGTSMGGDREGHQRIFEMARDAWRAAGRTEQPYLIGSFWCSLAPDAEAELKGYVYAYLKVAGDAIASQVANAMTCHTPGAIRAAIENVRAAGADELLICPATAHYDEVERLADLIS